MGEEMVEHLYIGLEELGKRWGKTSQELLTFVADPNVSTREKPILFIREVATTIRNGKRTDTHGLIWCAIRPKDIREYLVNPDYKIQEAGFLENGKIEMVRIYPGPKAFYKLKIFVIMSEVTRIEAEGGENSAFYKKVTQDLQPQFPIDSQPQNIPFAREESPTLSGKPEQLDQQHPIGGAPKQPLTEAVEFLLRELDPASLQDITTDELLKKMKRRIDPSNENFSDTLSEKVSKVNLTYPSKAVTVNYQIIGNKKSITPKTYAKSAVSKRISEFRKKLIAP